MSANLKVVQFVGHNRADIPNGLRKLADQIEQGDFGDAHNFAWVIDTGNSHVELGLLGSSASPGAEAHLLFAIAQRRLEGSIQSA